MLAVQDTLIISSRLSYVNLTYINSITSQTNNHIIHNAIMVPGRKIHRKNRNTLQDKELHSVTIIVSKVEVLWSCAMYVR